MSQHIRVLLFGPLAEIHPEKSLPVEGVATVGELERYLRSLDEAFRKNTFRIAVNRKFVLQDHVINSSDEVAVLPPFSGG